MPVTIRVRLPKSAYPALAEVGAAEDGVLFVEHAPDCGVREALMAKLLSRVLASSGAGKPQTSWIWVSPKPRLAYQDVQSWLQRSVSAQLELFKFGRTDIVVRDSATMFFLTPESVADARLPYLQDAVFEDAHLYDRDCEPHLRRTIGVAVAGQLRFAGRDEGFFRSIRSILSEGQSTPPRMLRITITEAVLGGWVDEERATKIRGSMGLPAFSRDFLLRPPEAPRRLPVTLFMQRRLHLRTDKMPGVMTERQRLEAKKQPTASAPIVPFDPSPLQRIYLQKKRLAKFHARSQGRPLRVLLLKYRRGGFSTVEQAENYFTCDSRPNSEVVTLAHTAGSTARIFGIARVFYEFDPQKPRLENPDSKTSFSFIDTRSKFFIGTAGSRGFSRGDSIQRVHGSEVAWWCRSSGDNSIRDVENLVAALSGAASNGDMILETTPNGVEWFYHKWQEAKSRQSDYVPIFLPWFVDPMNRIPAGFFSEEEIKDTLTEEEGDLRTLHGLDYSQIAFRRAKQREYGDLFKQEFPEDDISCFLTTGTPYFDLDTLEHLLRMKDRSPVWKRQSVPGGEIVFWEPPREGLTYVAGSDTSEGLPGCDENGTLVLERKSGRHVAQLYGLLSIEAQAKLGADLCGAFNKCLWGIERNNTSGGAVVAKAQELRYSHLYEFRDGRAGFSTDSQTRPVMLNELRDFMNEHGQDEDASGQPVLNLRSPQFLAQSRTFKLQADGKFAADPGAHDDAVMMAAIAFQMRKYGSMRPRITI